MKIPAPAKINIFLKVLGKRRDGYHELLTLMVPLSLFDEIDLLPRDKGISINAPGCKCADEKNLAFKAAELFFRETGAKGGVSIGISKHIPVGGGLGGGSSDASSVLMGMNELFGTGLSDDELMELAGRIGSDCPFFILKRPYLMGGRGEIPLQEVTLQKRFYLIVVPALEISTALVYSQLKCPLTLDDNAYIIGDIRVENGSAPETLLENHLEGPALSFCPEIRHIKAELLEAGALGALMSGSGSSVFGVYEDEAHVKNGMSLMRRHEGYSCIPTTSLTGVTYGDYRGKGVSG